MNEQQQKNINSENSLDLNPEKTKGDIWLKIVSVLIAVSIWFWVVGFESQVTQRKFTSIPVHMENLSDMKSRYSYSVLLDKDIYIDVTLEGKNSDLNRIKPSDIYAYVDLREVTQAGEISLPIEIKEINRAHVTDQSQSNAVIPIDKQISRSIPVQAEIIQMYKEAGVEIGSLILTPETVLVSGPERLINTISHAQVDLSLGYIERPIEFTQEFTLIGSDDEEVSNPYIKTGEKSIVVYVPVYSTKDVPLTVSYKYGYYNSQNAQITINPSKIKIRGSPEFLNNINEISIGTIDEKKYENDMSLKMNIPLQDGVTNLSGTTTADVEIKFKDMSTRLMSVSNSRFKVIPPKDFEYHIKEESIQIKLLGPSNRINSVPAGGIAVNIDLSSLTEKGTHPIAADVVVTSDTSVFCVGEYMINVEIY